MLIESAKDSLSFSVTHYKHPKQPLTVQVRHLQPSAICGFFHLWLDLHPIYFQAKTVEERKLWAHHIKRIILENHHAIIPQKVKQQHHTLTPETLKHLWLQGGATEITQRTQTQTQKAPWSQRTGTWNLPAVSYPAAKRSPVCVCVHVPLHAHLILSLCFRLETPSWRQGHPVSVWTSCITMVTLWLLLMLTHIPRRPEHHFNRCSCVTCQLVYSS